MSGWFSKSVKTLSFLTAAAGKVVFHGNSNVTLPEPVHTLRDRRTAP